MDREKLYVLGLAIIAVVCGFVIGYSYSLSTATVVEPAAMTTTFTETYTIVETHTKTVYQPTYMLIIDTDYGVFSEIENVAGKTHIVQVGGYRMSIAWSQDMESITISFLQGEWRNFIALPSTVEVKAYNIRGEKIVEGTTVIREIKNIEIILNWKGEPSIDRIRKLEIAIHRI